MSLQLHNSPSQTEVTPPALTAQSPADTMVALMMSSLITQAIYTAAELGVADQLAHGPQHIVELAAAVGADASALARLLRALASIGVFSEAEDEAGRFGLTPSAAYLMSEAPNSLRSLALMMGMTAQWRALGEFRHSIKTGQPAFDKALGKSLYSHLAQSSEDAVIFSAAINGFSFRTYEAIANAYDFTGCAQIIDVAGGQGGLLATILKRYPTMRGTLFDLPHVVPGAAHFLGEQGVADRAETVAGDFFKAVPGNHDIYLLEYVLHNWADKESISILKNIGAALPSHAKLLILEALIPPGNTPAFSKWLDLEMLAVTSGGKERTARDITVLVEAAGLRVSRIVPTNSPLHIIEAVPNH